MLVHILRDSPNNVFKDMTSTMACQVTRSFTNRACLDAGEATAAVEIQENNCADAKTYGGYLPQRGHKNDLIESMPRRISACIATREWLLLLTDFNLLQAVTA
ncbi:hypothetical protein TNCV_4370931 [Trichonephila clavipes]|nr:hypothetical protein TNCV_4370931 [Trichonephila clavipes]